MLWIWFEYGTPNNYKNCLWLCVWCVLHAFQCLDVFTKEMIVGGYMSGNHNIVIVLRNVLSCWRFRHSDVHHLLMFYLSWGRGIFIVGVLTWKFSDNFAIELLLVSMMKVSFCNNKCLSAPPFWICTANKSCIIFKTSCFRRFCC